MLTQGRDYLFFAKVDCTEQAMISTVARGAVVITPNLIAVIPEEEDAAALPFVKALLADDAVDLDKLENALRSLYRQSFTRWVFPLADLERLRVTSGLFGTITLKMRRESLRRLIIRDKGGKATAKAFLAARLTPPGRASKQSPATHCV